ncbi:MAG: hypothetical protein NTV05_17300 [Acidobacteria bacterium]|nr:hypothetical protein [Acidobacteriota bacterium]
MASTATFSSLTASQPSNRAGEGTAATEVPRGTLFHHYVLDAGGCVVAADEITPTAQNFSNVEEQLRATVRDGRGESDEVLRSRLAAQARRRSRYR